MEPQDLSGSGDTWLPSGDGPSRRAFPVVGVGASAGGLEAFIDLLKQLPAEPGLSFLFVQHIEPTHKSSLVEILSKVTPLKVEEAVEGTPVQVNRIYIIPPNRI